MTDRIPLAAQIIEIDREIKMRRHVYPRRVADGSLWIGTPNARGLK